MTALDGAVLTNACRWGRAAAETARVDRLGVEAAIWAGDATGTVHEIASPPDENFHVLGVGLTSYFCEPFADGRRLHTGIWKAGRAQIMRAGVRPRAVLGGRWRMLHVYMPPKLLAHPLGVEPGPMELGDPLGADDPALERLAWAFATELEAGGPLSHLQVESLSLALAVHLVRHWSNRGSASALRPTRGGLAPWQLKRACEALDARLDGDIGLERLAAVAGCSPTHFSRAFKQSTGVPPFTWLLGRRIERAKELLADPRLSLAEVALAVGFSAQPQFTTAFKRVTDATPGAWRRERLR